jgi:acetylglutamate kinase
MQLTIIKIGGNIIDDANKLESFLRSFAAIGGYKILVHGGGKIASDIGTQLGISPNYIDGRRITDELTLRLVTMVYGGLINKNIVASLQAYGCNAIGLTGADGNTIAAVKRPVTTIDYGFAGDVNSDGVNSALIGKLLNIGLTPVFAPLTYSQTSGILNTNADTIAQELAKAMAASMTVKLIYCFEKKGVLRNGYDDNSVIPVITNEMFLSLKNQGIISGGMIPKLKNAFEAISKGVDQVVIGHAEELTELMTANAGTLIR